MISEMIYMALWQLIWDTRRVISFEVIAAYHVRINESQTRVRWEHQAIYLYVIFISPIIPNEPARWVKCITVTIPMETNVYNEFFLIAHEYNLKWLIPEDMRNVNIVWTTWLPWNGMWYTFSYHAFKPRYFQAWMQYKCQAPNEV